MVEINKKKLRKYENCVCSSMRNISRDMTNYANKELRAVGIKITQLEILVTLNKVGILKMFKLSSILRLERSTLRRNLIILYNRKFVKVVKDEDSTNHLISLSNTGLNKILAALPIWEKIQLINKVKLKNYVSNLKDTHEKVKTQ